jgi:hypothetical protein
VGFLIATNQYEHEKDYPRQGYGDLSLYLSAGDGPYGLSPKIKALVDLWSSLKGQEKIERPSMSQMIDEKSIGDRMLRFLANE